MFIAHCPALFYFINFFINSFEVMNNQKFAIDIFSFKKQNKKTLVFAYEVGAEQECAVFFLQKISAGHGTLYNT